MKAPNTGPAAQLIDRCFAAKLALCRDTDSALGLKGTELWSFEWYLRFCYSMRRPGFVRWDIACGYGSQTN